MFLSASGIVFRRLLWASAMVVSVLGVGCGGGDEVRAGGSEGETGAVPDSQDPGVASQDRANRPQQGTDTDWEIFQSVVLWAWEEGLDTLPMGETMVRLGLFFVGTPYAPGTLEVAGREDVVVNLEMFDCVTLVENALALARFIKTHDPGVMESIPLARNAYRRGLQEIRYRGARVDGFPSRLHYFSDWIRDNEEKGLVFEITGELGGVDEYKSIDYMSTHPEAYRQLADGLDLMAIQEKERELSALPQLRIPEEDIGDMQAAIQNGDIVAATSTVEGLDVAHTGLAFWVLGDLHLIHAPLVGDSVEVSSQSLGERILRLAGQDGIRVVRPLEPAMAGGGTQAP